MTNYNSIELKEKVKRIKKTFLQMFYTANAGHVGSCLSCAEILGVIWFYYKRNDDRLILSKGHAAAALYATLYEANIISSEVILSFYHNNTTLPAHPPVNKIKEIPFATGSLGHGLSIAAGLGYSNNLRGVDEKVFCVTSDGEINEGSTWEAALFIAHHQLTNIVWIIDRNMLQGFGYTEETIQLDPLNKKLEAFGFNVIEVSGHSIEELMILKNDFKLTTKPIAVIANTIKGNGWNGKSNTLDSHYLPMKETEFSELINTLHGES